MRTRLVTMLVVAASLLVSGGALAQPSTIRDFRRGQVLTADELNRIVDQVNANTFAVEANEARALANEARAEANEARAAAAAAALGGSGGSLHRVACPSETIANALSQAQPGDTIRISGQCRENVIVDKDGITLDGSGTAVIHGTGAVASVIDITGHQNVTIKGLTVQNGHNGILIDLGGSARLEDVTATGNLKDPYGYGGNGIRVQNSSSVYPAGTISTEGNEGSGIYVTRSSSMANNPGGSLTIRADSNAVAGIAIANSSSMTLYGATLEVLKNDWGLAIQGVSSASMNECVGNFDGNRIGIGLYNNSDFGTTSGYVAAMDNTDRGMEIQEGSTASISGEVTGVFERNRIGIALFNNSGFVAHAGTVMASNNTDYGMLIRGGSGFACWGESTDVRIDNNGNYGVELYNGGRLDAHCQLGINDNSEVGINAWAASIIDLTGATITGNNWGITAWNGSFVRLDSTTVTGNGVTDIYENLGSTMGWLDSRIGSVDCGPDALLYDHADCTHIRRDRLSLPDPLTPQHQRPLPQAEGRKPLVKH